MLLLIAGAFDKSTARAVMLIGPVCFVGGQWTHYFYLKGYDKSQMAALKERMHKEFQKVSVTFNETDLTQVFSARTATFEWTYFVAAEQANSLFWIWTDEDSAIVIPARAFADATEQAAAMAFACARIVQ